MLGFVRKAFIQHWAFLEEEHIFTSLEICISAIWGTDENFIVKSAYAFIEESHINSNCNVGASSNSSLENLWKLIWSMEIRRKIKIITWKAYHKGLPVGEEMLKRLGLDDVRCRFCNFSIESSIHLFKYCWWLKALCNSLGLNTSHLNFQFSSFAD